MISYTKEPELFVVSHDILLELRNPGVILVLSVTFHKASIELNDHW